MKGEFARRMLCLHSFKFDCLLCVFMCTCLRVYIWRLADLFKKLFAFFETRSSAGFELTKYGLARKSYFYLPCSEIASVWHTSGLKEQQKQKPTNQIIIT